MTSTYIPEEPKETGTKLKNQVGKPVDKVTLRYVFQKFEEFMINIYEDGYRLFDILNDQQNKILEL